MPLGDRLADTAGPVDSERTARPVGEAASDPVERPPHTARLLRRELGERSTERERERGGVFGHHGVVNPGRVGERNAALLKIGERKRGVPHVRRLDLIPRRE